MQRKRERLIEIISPNSFIKSTGGTIVLDGYIMV